MTPERAIDYALKGQPAAPSPSAADGTLSPRELEVLRLVADGLTDGQIAEKLYISPCTVGNHLRSIYKKLGVPSRAAAVRQAIERLLI
jgi:DNA-binding NarL/FixJ family response regulator